MKRYINTNDNGVETIDEFDYNNRAERKEAHRCLTEYRMYCATFIWLSQRCTKEWKNK